MSSIHNWISTSTASGQPAISHSELWNRLAKSKEFREHFNAMQLKRGIAFQVRALLKKRGWTQAQLAESAGLTQGVVSRAQDPNYGKLTFSTAQRIAGGFDVAFIGAFVPYGELVDWFEHLSEDIGDVQSFEEEYKKFLKGRVRRGRARRRGIGKGAVRAIRVRVATPTSQLELPLSSIKAEIIPFPSQREIGGSMDRQIPIPKAKIASGGALYAGI